mmetsp:Transcript_31880/g.82914  ORF Transcript_31880/g.82914 Transcript_31880/m.82914 type:complete len:274 (+) Transcript_31880:646-1467(+)
MLRVMQQKRKCRCPPPALHKGAAVGLLPPQAATEGVTATGTGIRGGAGSKSVSVSVTKNETGSGRNRGRQGPGASGRHLDMRPIANRASPGMRRSASGSGNGRESGRRDSGSESGTGSGSGSETGRGRGHPPGGGSPAQLPQVLARGGAEVALCHQYLGAQAEVAVHLRQASAARSVGLTWQLHRSGRSWSRGRMWRPNAVPTCLLALSSATISRAGSWSLRGGPWPACWSTGGLSLWAKGPMCLSPLCCTPTGAQEEAPCQRTLTFQTHAGL